MSKTATANSPTKQRHTRCPHQPVLAIWPSKGASCPLQSAASKASSLGFEGSASRSSATAPSSCLSRLLLDRCSRSAVAMALARSRSELRRCSTSAMAFSRGRLLKMSNCHSYCSPSPSSTAASSVISSRGDAVVGLSTCMSSGPLVTAASMQGSSPWADKASMELRSPAPRSGGSPAPLDGRAAASPPSTASWGDCADASGGSTLRALAVLQEDATLASPEGSTPQGDGTTASGSRGDKVSGGLLQGPRSGDNSPSLRGSTTTQPFLM
mmetsp:Transcript_65998/g.175788  ORF Transcript_65998/g.175788 Transcript_65998/m.175788 type:complete len:269 (+) Transcript_65998:563-1369(+)